MNNSGLELWAHAKEIIPGGNGLISKRPERFAPDIWPTYYSKAKGIEIWDLDNNKYIDMSYMGIGTAILGYSDKDINNSVKLSIDKSINTTLNFPDEVYLAEKLLELNPFAENVKFARTGGEAMSIAIRISRTYTGKDKIAFSGYHGWSDWYISANLNNKNNLDNHLIKGIGARGIPQKLENTSFPFEYNNFDSLKKILDKEDIGTIVIEGSRYSFPNSDFLESVNKISKEKGIVIIFDEITSGWRMTSGGVYKLYNFEPDIVVYGKAMGNGFAISAIVGKKNVMKEAENTFISSTFWTESIGFTAGLTTINKICENKIWEHINYLGNILKIELNNIFQNYELNIDLTDFLPLITFKFKYEDKNSALSTLYTQEMLKRGYLATNSVYLSFSHQESDIEKYIQNAKEVFHIIYLSLKNNDLFERLQTSVREEGFSVRN